MGAADPVPFEIVREDEGLCVASNGAVQVVAHGAAARMFRRRGIRGIARKPAAEVLLPQLNELAGELVSNPDMDAREAVARLLAIAGTVPTSEPQRMEWVVAELDGVRVYVDGSTVIVTREDLIL